MSGTVASSTGSDADPRHVYIHVPFCGRRCSYCDFSIAVRREVPVNRFIDAIMAEMVTRSIGPLGAAPLSIYLGGGTPSKLGGDGVARLLDSVSRRLGVAKLSTFNEDIEVTVEANPEDLTAIVAHAWAEAGVNRVSLGVQSFDASVLEWMHREHSPDQAAVAVEALRGAGIQNISLDLIYALPKTLNRDWQRDLDSALALEPSHLSVYGLTIEPQTPLGRWASAGEVRESPEESYEEEFLLADRRLGEAGFEHYEVSNYAKLGRRSRHNSSYWTGVPYLGLGPSAHGFDGRTRRWNVAAYAKWLELVEQGADPFAGSEDPGDDGRRAEEVYLGLRASGGLSIHHSEVEMVTRWVREGWGRLDKQRRLRLSPSGWLRMDALATELIAARERA
ncbi:MAG: radical SAM family heme chaperone HemW [Gemmatimonadaceae bacterium]|nr:radical SAM family heme chaperone HemW [Gemmatimonadaceae bacterium]